MAYKHGDPPIGASIFFRAASALTFYPVWFLAQSLINGVMHKTRYINRQVLRACRRAILVSNHTTFLDPVLMSGAALPHLMWQSLLESTVETPFLGTFVRLLGGFPLPEGVSMNRLKHICETGFRYRRFIHFYPEGECYLYNQRIQPFKDGAFYLAAELHVPVIPMVTVFTGGPARPKETLVVLEPVHPSAYIQRNSAGRVNMASVRAYRDAVRARMQSEIDRRGGTQSLFKGPLARITGINA
jgi:1-acyl-sn-glycerol-3-phosphate acyltransferase